jgi:hypothetical protein
MLAAYGIRDGDRLALDQDHPSGEPGDCEVRDIVRLEEYSCRGGKVERRVAGEGDGAGGKIGKDVDGPERGPLTSFRPVSWL